MITHVTDDKKIQLKCLPSLYVLTRSTLTFTYGLFMVICFPSSMSHLCKNVGINSLFKGNSGILKH